jgi:hypothetical protein
MILKQTAFKWIYSSQQEMKRHVRVFFSHEWRGKDLNIISVDGLGVLQTTDHFVIIIHDKIHGPFPNTLKWQRKIIALFKDGGSTE